MKKLSKEAQFNLKNIFGSLFSNKCAIEAGKSLPFWSSILVAILGVGLAVTPIIVNAGRSKGSDALNGTYTYNIERKVAIAAVTLNNNNVRMEVDANHKLTYYKNDVAQNDNVKGSELLMAHVNYSSKEYEVRAYFVNDYDGKTYSENASEIMKTQYVVGSTTPKSDTDPSDTKYYIPATLFFYADGFGAYTYKLNTTTSASTFVGDYINVEPCELIKTFATVNGAIPATIDEISNPGYEAGVLGNLKAFYDKAYLQIWSRTLLYSSTIYTAVYLGLVILLGLLMFVITRGKKNFNNYLKWYQCMFIACWCSFTPGLLSLVLGFIFPAYSVMMFILFMGVRTMWLTMKQLSPTYNG